MRVLLSAYACEPGKGSEPGVGWHWALEIARRGHDVTVLTRTNNRAAIEAAKLTDSTLPEAMKFEYCDLCAAARRIKRFVGILPYYAVWQWQAFRVAKRLHAQKPFDIVHHITFGGIRHFSLMGCLGAPFILGPLGGGESSPFRLRWHTGWRGGLRDTLRDAMNIMSRVDPVGKSAARQAQAVYVKTVQTLSILPSKCRAKTRVSLEIGVDAQDAAAASLPAASRYRRLLFVGRFLHWKGMAIGLRALERACRAAPDLTLTLVGSGPEEKRWRCLAEQLHVTSHVNFSSWMPHDQLIALYANHGILLFPSLHDSSGNVVLEALSHGLPVVCLDLGGPGTIVDADCGRRIAVDHGDFDSLLDEIAEAILSLTESPEVWMAASNSARAAATRWRWADRVEALGVY